MNARVHQLYDDRELELLAFIAHLERERAKADIELFDAQRELDEYRRARDGRGRHRSMAPA